MVNKAVSNTGPLIHLDEINLIKVFNIFRNVYIPQEVKNELKNLKISSKIKIIDLTPKYKDLTKILVNNFSLDLGESQAIALTIQEKAEYFITDDLDARTVAKLHHIKVHGTIGIILRAFRQRIIDKETAIKKVNELYDSSSLFITRDFIDYIIQEIKKFKKK